VPNRLPDHAYPLVIVLHGGQQTLDKAIRQTPARWMQLADRDKFIVVYPAGREENWNDCRGDQTLTDADDVGFINALIDEVSRDYAIDPERIYASGASNGGMMCYRLARELSHRIAAIGALIANNPAVDTACSAPVNPVSVLIMNGTADPLMKWDGGCIENGRGECQTANGTVVSTPDTVAFWKTFLHTDAEASIENFPNRNRRDDCTVTRETYSNGDNGTELVLYKINNGGHTYPTIRWKVSALVRSRLGIGNQDGDIEGVDYIWDFFKQHTLAN
jgi:polyhydroxybutyrate depolymerase